MKCQRRGSDLKTMIRIALSVLKRDPNEIDTRRMSITEMEELHRELYAEYKAKKAAPEVIGVSSGGMVFLDPNTR